MRAIALIGFIYLVIAFTCVGMSGWSTYHGFLSMFKELALPITLVISAGLIACDIAILNWRRHGYSLIGVVLLLLMFTAFSAAANYNFFYTNYMRDRLAQERVLKAKANHDNNMVAAETVLKREALVLSQQGQPRHEKIEQALKAMRDEVEDKSREGWGPKARGHLAEVYSLLGVKIAEREPPKPRSSASENNQALVEIEKRVRAVLEAEKSKIEKGAAPLASALEKIVEGRSEVEKSMRSLPTTTTLGGVDYFKERLKAIGQMNRYAADIEGRVEQAMTVIGKPQKIALERTRDDGIELDTIPNSFQSGFYEPQNVPIASGLAVLAVLLDLIPLMFALVFVRPASAAEVEKEKEKKPPPPPSGDGIIILDRTLKSRATGTK